MTVGAYSYTITGTDAGKTDAVAMVVQMGREG